MDKHRQTKTGVIISKSGAQTIIVRVDAYVAHPLYKKRMRKTKRFATHDAENRGQVGDTVIIGETRPISKTKRWELVDITKHTETEAI